MAPAYQAADVLVHPTLEDSYAMVVLEAMANGLPVVVSGPKFCGIARDLTDGEQALLLVEPNNAAKLTKLVKPLFEETPLANCLIEQGFVYAQKHSWEIAALEFEKVFF